MARLARSAAIALALVCAGPAAAQLPRVGGLGAPSLPALPSAILGGAGDLTGRLGALTPRALADLRLERLTDLVRANRRVLDRDEAGNPIVRGEILATSPSPAALAEAARLGLTVVRRETLPELGLELVTLRAERGLREAVRRLRRADPAGGYDYNHLYFGAGGAAANQAASLAQVGSTTALGLVDTGLDTSHPALAKTIVETRAFAPGGYRPAAHGLAVASLMAGEGRLFCADVYGAGPAGGSAEAVVRALAWLAQSKAGVINVSLVGPPNGALGAAVRALVEHGVLVVAAVGNDGPAAPPAYPASYPGVIAVTGVDKRGKVLLEAGRAAHVDFAAPGADIAAARPGGLGPVRGTSFAAPIVAAKLAALVRAGSTDPVAALARQAQDLGGRGVDNIYGRGMIGGELFIR